MDHKSKSSQKRSMQRLADRRATESQTRSDKMELRKKEEIKRYIFLHRMHLVLLII